MLVIWNIGFVSDEGLQVLTYFITPCEKWLICSPAVTSESPYWEAKLTVTDTSFPEFRKLAFYHWLQIDSIVFLNDRYIACSVWKMSAQSPPLNSCRFWLSGSLSAKRGAFWKKKNRPLHNLATGALCTFIKKDLLLRVGIQWQFKKCVCLLDGFLTGNVWHWGAQQLLVMVPLSLCAEMPQNYHFCASSFKCQHMRKLFKKS